MNRVTAIVDTCIWISAYMASDPDHFATRAFVDEIHRGRHKIFLPDVVLTETVCRVARYYRAIKRDPVDAVRLGARLAALPSISWLQVNQEYCQMAAELGARHKLRGMDALIAYAAVRNRCELITNDSDFHDSTLANIIKIRAIK